MVTRKDITTCLMFLVFVMVIMNFYTLLVFWKSRIDTRVTRQALDKFQKGRGPHQALSTTPKLHLSELDKDEPVSSVRFRVSYVGNIMRLLIPKDFLPSLTKQFLLLEENILTKFNEENIAPPPHLHKIVTLNRRLTRALGGARANNIIQDTQKINFMKLRSNLALWSANENVINDGVLGQVLSFLSHVKIIQASGSRRGTQLKLELLFEGGELAFFKPAWYPLDVHVHGDPFGGKDRHYGEIAAFYLAQLLDYKSGPIVVGRKINLLQEILPYSTNQLNNTFFRNSGGDLCFYGVCYYCKKEDPICSNGSNMIEGAVVLHMKQKFKLFPNPWRRTYKKNTYASWETSMSYCHGLLEDIKASKRIEFLLDIVAVAAFDFLIGNADRHHFELFANHEAASGHVRSIALLDNGKSFGDSEEDYFDILAPLYQCCIIRKALVSTLDRFKGALGETLDSVTAFDPLYPLLTQPHLTAINRRLNILIATVKVCQDQRNTDDYHKNVIL